LPILLSPPPRDKELAKFEAFLNKEGCMHIIALMRPRQRMAYPIKG
jgi:small subunit ribosomal protein S6